MLLPLLARSCCFFVEDPRPAQVSPLSLHAALPIYGRADAGGLVAAPRPGRLRGDGSRRTRRRVRFARRESAATAARSGRSEEHTSELQSRLQLVCRLRREKKKTRLRCSRG